MKGSVFVVFLVLLLSVAAQATTFVNRPLGEVVKETANIVRGRPGESYSDWGKGENRQIFTYTPFVVTEVLKGGLRENRILLRQPGGGKDGMEMNVPGTAHFNTTEDVVVMLGERNKEDDSYDIPGFTTGKYSVVPGENGEPALVNSLGGGALYDPNRDPRTLSYNSKIPLEVFRRIAKGEDIPEGAHRQYEGSRRPAPREAFEAGHSHEPAAPKAAAPTPRPRPGDQPDAAAVRPPESGGRSIWIPISFAVLALAGGILLWRMSSKGG